MSDLLNKLMLQCYPLEANFIKKMVQNEQKNYVAVRHGKPLLKSIWELSHAVQEQKFVKLYYERTDQEIVERLVKPLGVTFAEYYFYLIAEIYDWKYEEPVPYRIDRIRGYSITDEKFRVSYASRFEEGEFRKRVQFMQPGKLMTIYLKYWGKSEEAIRDRLPTSEIIKKERDAVFIKAEVFGYGIKMWLLSQAEYLEVIGPTWFREEIKETIAEMLANYQK